MPTTKPGPKRLASKPATSGDVADPVADYGRLLVDRLEQGATAENWSASRRAIAAHLQDYLAGRAAHIDREIARQLLAALEQIEAKESPDLLRPLPKRRGESPNTAAVDACIAAAGTYIRFCLDLENAGIPEIDPAPVKTVADAYRVDRRTASRWKTRGESHKGADRWAWVRAAMNACAVQYARFGGASSAAVRQRSRGDTD